MAERTTIQWCDSTVNPTMGCDGCELWDDGRRICYAGTLHETRGKSNKGFAPSFEQVTAFPGRSAKAARWSDLRGIARPEKPWLDGYPRLIFVSDMGDSLSRNVSFEYLHAEVIEPALGAHGQRHVWQWLTKRPHRMAEFAAWLLARGIAWPSNVWVGTSITNGGTTNRVKSLLRVGDETTTRFLSVEPQIEGVDLTAWLPQLDWIIQGGESGRAPRTFDLGWARSLRDECAKYGVSYFLKQLGASVVEAGSRLKLLDSHGGDWDEWPEDLRVRQLPPPGKRATTVQLADALNIAGRLSEFEQPSAVEGDEAPAASLPADLPSTPPVAVTPAASNWPPLLNPEQRARPVFPLHALAEWHREFVLDAARVTQVAVDAAVLFSLAMIGAAAAKRIRVSLSSDGQDQHPLNIWVLLVLASGDGKTPLLRLMAREFEQAQAALREQAAADAVSRRVRRDVAQRRYTSLVQRCAKSTDAAELALLEEQTMTLRGEIAALEERPAPRLLVEDMTVEALVMLMAENGGALLAASDEGSRFFGNAGRSSPGGIANIEAALKSHSAATLHVDRVSRASLVVHEPTLSLALATQSQTLGKILANESFEGRGLWERFLFVCPPSMVGSRSGVSALADDWAHSNFHAKLAALLALPRFERHLVEPEVPELRLWSSWKILRDFLEGLDRRMGPGGDLSRGPLLGWSNKLKTNVARLAGILWITDNTVSRDWRNIDVPDSVVERAIEVGFYFLNHAQLLLGRERSALEGDVETVLTWLQGQKAFRVRDLQRAFATLFPRRQYIDPVLAVLMRRNAIRPTASSGAVGRPPEQYEVHPDIAGGRVEP